MLVAENGDQENAKLEKIESLQALNAGLTSLEEEHLFIEEHITVVLGKVEAYPKDNTDVQFENYTEQLLKEKEQLLENLESSKREEERLMNDLEQMEKQYEDVKTKMSNTTNNKNVLVSVFSN